MKKILVLCALLCCMVCTAVPVFADAAPGGVGRDDVLAGDFSTSETAASGDDMKDAFNEYGGKLPGIIDEVKKGWEEVFSGLAGVFIFLGDTIGGLYAAMPASYSVYIVMLCLCIAVSAIIRVLTE